MRCHTWVEVLPPDDKSSVFCCAPFTLNLTPSTSHFENTFRCQSLKARIWSDNFLSLGLVFPLRRSRIFFTRLICKSSKSHWDIWALASRICLSCSAIWLIMLWRFFCCLSFSCSFSVFWYSSSDSFNDFSPSFDNSTIAPSVSTFALCSIVTVSIWV